jgi:predicted nucleic acid-binding protein
VEGPRTFVDTNVLVYAHDADAGRKGAVASALVRDLWESRRGVLSTQVLQELYVTLTRKIAKPLAARHAREIVEAYAAWEIVAIDARDVVRASTVEASNRISFWDALIIVAAGKARAARILSEDLSAGQAIEGVRIENPFARAPRR